MLKVGVSGGFVLWMGTDGAAVVEVLSLRIVTDGMGVVVVEGA